MSAQTQCAAADVTAETLSVEEESLRTETLHDVHTLLTEVTCVAAAQTLRKLLTHARLKHNIMKLWGKQGIQHILLLQYCSDTLQ